MDITGTKHAIAPDPFESLRDRSPAPEHGPATAPPEHAVDLAPAGADPSVARPPVDPGEALLRLPVWLNAEGARRLDAPLERPPANAGAEELARYVAQGLAGRI